MKTKAAIVTTLQVLSGVVWGTLILLGAAVMFGLACGCAARMEIAPIGAEPEGQPYVVPTTEVEPEPDPTSETGTGTSGEAVQVGYYFRKIACLLTRGQVQQAFDLARACACACASQHGFGDGGDGVGQDARSSTDVETYPVPDLDSDEVRSVRRHADDGFALLEAATNE